MISEAFFNIFKSLTQDLRHCKPLWSLALPVIPNTILLKWMNVAIVPTANIAKTNHFVCGFILGLLNTR